MAKLATSGSTKVAVKLARNVYRAFKVHCLLEEKDEGGQAGLALTRYLEEHGGPQVKQLLREVEKPEAARVAK